MVQEGRVDCFADGIVSAKRERNITDAAAHFRVGEVFLDALGGVNELHRVVVVLFDTGRDGEDVRVEDDVLGGEADLLREDTVGTLADGEFAVGAVGLATFVERHHDHGCAIAAHERGLAHELGFAFLERNRIHDSLSLHALEAGLDHAPLR